MEIDHVVLASRNRAEAEAAIAAVELGIARGRVIPGAGLSNLVVPLGDSLLEVHYPNGEEVAPDGPPYAAIQRTALERHPEPLVPVAWLVRIDDDAQLRKLAADNSAPVTEVPAGGPGYPGYTLGGLGAAFTRPWLPTLIHWAAPQDQWPTALAAPHGRQPIGTLELDVSGPAYEIERWCGGWPNGLRAVDGREGPMRVRIGFVDGPPVTLGVDSDLGTVSTS